MNIVYASHVPIPSHRAYAVHVMHMCSAFAELGHNVTLYSLPGSDLNSNVHSYYGIKNKFNIKYVRQIGFRGIAGLIYGWNIVSICRKNIPPNVFYSRHIYSAFFASLNGWKVIYEVHMPVKNIFHRAILRFIYKRNYNFKIISITNSLKKKYLKDLKFLKLNDIQVHPDGSKLPRKYSKIQKQNTTEIGYIGNLYPGKGIELIIKIAALLPEINFHIIGGRDSDINFWKKKYNGKNLKFHGYINHGDLDKFYNLFNICLLPLQNYVSPDGGKADISKWTSPMKMFEYMSHNKAIIASDLPVLQEILKNNYNAIIVESKNAKLWIKAIKLLLKDNSLLMRLANNAYFDIKNRYTWKARCENILSNIK